MMELSCDLKDLHTYECGAQQHMVSFSVGYLSSSALHLALMLAATNQAEDLCYGISRL